MSHEVFLKHIDSNTNKANGTELSQKWIDHGYNTLQGMFALYAGAMWDVRTEVQGDYVALSIQGQGSKEEAVAMVLKIVSEHNWAIRGLGLRLYDPATRTPY